MFVNPFKARKLLLQAKKHVEDVNRINDELIKLSEEQLETIKQLNLYIRKLENKK